MKSNKRHTKSVFIAGGASYNNVVQLEKFPEQTGKTYHHCKYHEGIGSTGAGKSLNLAKLDFDVTLHTLLGEDEYKNKILAELSRENIHTLFDLDPRGTERHINILNGKGERISIFTNPISDHIDIDTTYIEYYIANADHVVINIYNYCKQLLPICKKQGVPIWTDLHDYDGGDYYDEFIDSADYLFMSNEYIKEPVKQIEAFIRAGKSLAVCTLAHDGAVAMNDEGDFIEIPAAEKYIYQNSNGAGDAFFSGFLYGHTQGKSLKDCMNYASHAAGTCIESLSLYNQNLCPNILNEKKR